MKLLIPLLEESVLLSCRNSLEGNFMTTDVLFEDSSLGSKGSSESFSLYLLLSGSFSSSNQYINTKAQYFGVECADLLQLTLKNSMKHTKRNLWFYYIAIVSLLTLFTETKGRQGDNLKLDEKRKSHSNCRHVYSHWTGTGAAAAAGYAVFSSCGWLCERSHDAAITQPYCPMM